jgi:hypothetical protein
MMIEMYGSRKEEKREKRARGMQGHDVLYEEKEE